MANTGFIFNNGGFFRLTKFNDDGTIKEKGSVLHVDYKQATRLEALLSFFWIGEPTGCYDGTHYYRKCVLMRHQAGNDHLVVMSLATIKSNFPFYGDIVQLPISDLEDVGFVSSSIHSGLNLAYGEYMVIGQKDNSDDIYCAGSVDDITYKISSGATQIYDNGACGDTTSMFQLSTQGTNNGLITDYTPNEQGGTSDTGGGDGAFEISSDIIEQFDVSKLISAINTGFMRAYAIKPNEMQLIRDLATYMWTSNFVDNLKKLWGDPMNVIMGLSAIPVTPARGGVQNVVLGNVQSPVAMPPATSQYVVHNCGSITIKKYWGNYLDYKYTKASIYLPFIGGQELDIQKVMGKTLSLAYIIDIVSGACSAQLVADGSVIGNWQGSCAMGLPISAENFSRYYVGALGSAGAGLIKGASAGPIGALAGAVTGAAVNAVMNAPHVEMNGNVSGAGGYMSCRRPYIQLTLPRQSLAEIYNEIEGYPCNITYTLGDLTGYTVVQNVHLENIIATADELEEIEELLKGGVIF